MNYYDFLYFVYLGVAGGAGTGLGAVGLGGTGLGGTGGAGRVPAGGQYSAAAKAAKYGIINKTMERKRFLCWRSIKSLILNQIIKSLSMLLSGSTPSMQSAESGQSHGCV